MIQLLKGDCLIESDKIESGSVDFIGIEQDDNYFNIAQKRIND